jgi:hypothetical protein
MAFTNFPMACCKNINFLSNSHLEGFASTNNKYFAKCSNIYIALLCLHSPNHSTQLKRLAQVTQTSQKRDGHRGHM